MNAYRFEIGSGLSTCAELKDAASQILDAVRRLAKEVNPERERNRLAVAIGAIERLVRESDPHPRVISGVELQKAIDGLPVLGSVRLPFCIPDHTGLGSGREGYFLSLIPFGDRPVTLDSWLNHHARQSSHRTTGVTVGSPASTADEKDNRLEARIRRAGNDGRAVALGRSRHSEITKALRSEVHTAQSLAPFFLHFIYPDGSLSGPIQLRALPVRNRPSTGVQFNIGLESCRHFTLDRNVDYYLLRNAEVKRREALDFHEQELLAYKRASRLLNTIVGESGTHIRLYHTGLEPAVVGTYRAIIDVLAQGRPLVVTPIFFEGGKDQSSWW